MPTLSDPPVRASGNSRPNAGRSTAGKTSSDPAKESLNAPGSSRHPLQVTWQMTQACDWKTAPVRARSRRERDHFSTAEAFHLVEEVAAMHVPLLALTGGDPLLRPDLFPVIEFAARRSVRTSLTLLPTPLVDAAAIAEMKASGLMRVGFWLHGSTAALDDEHWAVPGCHRRTLGVIASCHEVELPVQINTIVSRRNFHDLDPMIELLTRLDVDLWNVFFFVPPSREQAGEMLTADEHEQVFAKLYAASKVANFQIKTTEGQHYQRYVMQQRVRESRGRLTEAGLTEGDVLTRGPKAVNEGKGFVFINHAGEVYPSRFLPLSGGNVTTQPLAEVYCDSPLLVSLLDSSRLTGKCGRCKFRTVCGGSRARAYALTGDLFASDPGCAYQP